MGQLVIEVLQNINLKVSVKSAEIVDEKNEYADFRFAIRSGRYR